MPYGYDTDILQLYKLVYMFTYDNNFICGNFFDRSKIFLIDVTCEVKRERSKSKKNKMVGFNIF